LLAGYFFFAANFFLQQILSPCWHLQASGFDSETFLINMEGRLTAFLFVFAAVFVAVTIAGPAKRSVENDQFKNQLKELEKDGTVVHETEHREYHNVNGNAQEKDVKEATVHDAKTGAEVAKVVEEMKSVNNKPVEKTLKVDVPSAGVHVEAAGLPEDLPSAEETASYIFESGDIEGVEKTMESLVSKNQMSKRASNDYMKLVRTQLQQMHEQALAQMQDQTSQEDVKKQQILQELVGFTENLNEQHKTYQQLSAYLDYLYTMARSGDREANEVLDVYAELMKEAVKKGTLDPEVEKAVYDVVLKSEMEDQVLEKQGESAKGNVADVQVANLHQMAGEQKEA